MIKLKPSIKNLVVASIVVISCWNIWVLFHSIADLPPRNVEGFVVQEARYHPVRDLLQVVGYFKGPIDFVTNRDLKGQPMTGEDQNQWVRAQYMMVPWIVTRNHQTLSGPPFAQDAPYVIGDFWDGEPSEIPPDLVRVLDTGKGLILFKRNPRS